MLSGASIPRLAPGVRLQHDPVRDRWVVQAPERLFVPDQIAVEILRLLDGTRSLDGIIDELASRYAAPRAEIAEDVTVLLEDLASRGVVAA